MAVWPKFVVKVVKIIIDLWQIPSRFSALNIIEMKFHQVINIIWGNGAAFNAASIKRKVICIVCSSLSALHWVIGAARGHNMRTLTRVLFSCDINCNCCAYIVLFCLISYFLFQRLARDC